LEGRQGRTFYTFAITVSICLGSPVWVPDTDEFVATQSASSVAGTRHTIKEHQLEETFSAFKADTFN
jgi:hypothetical protein